MKLQQQKQIASLFGNEMGQSLIDIPLESEVDFVNFAKIVYTKLKSAESRKFMISFVNEILSNIDKDVKTDDLQDIQSKVTVLLNNKIKVGKGKQKPTKAGDITSASAQSCREGKGRPVRLIQRRWSEQR
jgi:hypothetical protein